LAYDYERTGTIPDDGPQRLDDEACATGPRAPLLWESPVSRLWRNKSGAVSSSRGNRRLWMRNRVSSKVEKRDMTVAVTDTGMLSGPDAGTYRPHRSTAEAGLNECARSWTALSDLAVADPEGHALGRTGHRTPAAGPQGDPAGERRWAGCDGFGISRGGKRVSTAAAFCSDPGFGGKRPGHADQVSIPSPTGAREKGKNLDRLMAEHDSRRHPMVGPRCLYPSFRDCWPCHQAGGSRQDVRAGAGRDREDRECGIHVARRAGRT